MPLGLPLRVTIVTTEPNGMPLCSPAFQSAATRPASTSRVMSGSTEKLTKSAGGTGGDLARLVARGAVGLLEGHALARVGGVERRDDLVEADLGHGIREEVEGARRRLGGVLGGGGRTGRVARSTTGTGRHHHRTGGRGGGQGEAGTTAHGGLLRWWSDRAGRVGRTSCRTSRSLDKPKLSVKQRQIMSRIVDGSPA